MGSGLTTRHYSSRLSAGGAPITGAQLPQCPWSKIGAEPTNCILQRVSVVNLPLFPHLARLERHRPRGPAFPAHPICSRCLHLRHADAAAAAAVTIAEDAVRARACGGLDIAKPIPEIVGIVGEWIADDRTFSTRTLFARSGPRASCSFWYRHSVRPVSFCDGERPSYQPLPAAR